MRFAISAGLEVKESCEDLCECVVTEEMEDIAESMDEVRPKGRSSGRTVVLLAAVEVTVDGDRGGGPAVYCEDGSGDETFRTWLYDVPLGEPPLVVSSASESVGGGGSSCVAESSVANSSSNRSRGDLG